MYKALHTPTGEEIILLHPRWRSRLAEVRRMTTADEITCPGCGQSVRLKAGPRKRPHFAHKHLAACSLGSESPEILLARAVLYEWLLGQFPGGVTLEKDLDGAGLPRPVDCWVDLGPGCQLAYWIVDAGLRLEAREAILRALGEPPIRPTWVMLADMLSPEAKALDSLLLTPTERAFLQVTPYDAACCKAGSGGASLSYLDAEAGALVTYRGLTLLHPPNWYAGARKAASLPAARADPASGGFVYPGEAQKLKARAERAAKLTQKRALLDQMLARPPEPPRPAAPERPPQAPEPLPCLTCGQITSDYWAVLVHDGRRVCRCRECLNAGA